ncbi:hypothetical protein ABIF52_006003 [Bradyrhizobium japonicum]
MYAAVARSAAYCQVKTTSSAVKGLPSCHRTPCFSFQVTLVPSGERPPFALVGTSAARQGMRLPSLSQPASGSKKMREATWSLVPSAKCGLSKVGACQIRIFSGPPPPALVGLYGKVASAIATSFQSRIWLATGAAIPTAAIVRMNERRDSVPSFTSAMALRISFSFIG